MGYYKACAELDRCIEINKLWNEKKFERFFSEYLELAEKTHYPYAECQVGFMYIEGEAVRENLQKGLYWITLSAEHGDREGQNELAWIYETGICGEIDMEKAKYWYKKSALQKYAPSIEKCRELDIPLDE